MIKKIFWIFHQIFQKNQFLPGILKKKWNLIFFEVKEDHFHFTLSLSSLISAVYIFSDNVKESDNTAIELRLQTVTK